MRKIVWVLPLIGSVLAILVAVGTVLMAGSAPKEAAGFAMACALAIIPYVIARSIAELAHNQSLEKNVSTLTRIVAEATGKIKPGDKA